MVLLATPDAQRVQVSDPFFSLFPHRFDYLYAPHPEPGISPAWQTETRHPLTDRLLHEGHYLYGVRFSQQTQYCLLDIDRNSPYHPANDPLAIQRIVASLESVGLVSYLVCTSSYSGGLHLYFPFQSLQNSWELGAVITTLLENAGLTVKPGLLEVFPNRKGQREVGKSLFNGHRLPLQAGSYLLNRDLEPVWSDQNHFARQWRKVQQQNIISPSTLKQALKQQRQRYSISGKAAKFLNDLNTEIEQGWTDYGQTNYLLGRIALRTYIFHHVLENSAPLEGQALIDQIMTIAQSLPGYSQWCRHQNELEHRVSEWASCVENSRYFHYGYAKLQVSSGSLAENSDNNNKPEPSWNQQQSQAARERIRQAIAALLNQNALPCQAGARFKVLTCAGIGGGSLYRHKDLWHPDFLGTPPLTTSSPMAILPINDPEPIGASQPVQKAQQEPQMPDPVYPEVQPSFTNLFAQIGGNTLQHQVSDDLDTDFFQQIGRKPLTGLVLQFQPQLEQVEQIASSDCVANLSQIYQSFSLLPNSLVIGDGAVPAVGVQQQIQQQQIKDIDNLKRYESIWQNFPWAVSFAAGQCQFLETAGHTGEEAY